MMMVVMMIVSKVKYKLATYRFRFLALFCEDIRSLLIIWIVREGSEHAFSLFSACVCLPVTGIRTVL